MMESPMTAEDMFDNVMCEYKREVKAGVTKQAEIDRLNTMLMNMQATKESLENLLIEYNGLVTSYNALKDLNMDLAKENAQLKKEYAELEDAYTTGAPMAPPSWASSPSTPPPNKENRESNLYPNTSYEDEGLIAMARADLALSEMTPEEEAIKVGGTD